MEQKKRTNVHYDFDYVIVGSGFGGSVSAMRLSQKGYSVAVIESGKRWRSEDFPKSNWSLNKYLWMPRIGFYGIQRLNLLKDFFLVSGAGVGGGSLVYANTLYVPGDKVLDSPAFKKMGGKSGMLPFYSVASRMLGVTQNPQLYESDFILKEIAEEMGRGETFRPTPVGVFFGEKPGKLTKDPYFLGEGPDRVTCNHCGGCMVGCRFNSKNTLDKNYLYFAERMGTKIFPEAKVVSLVPLNESGVPDPAATGEFGYQIQTRSTTGLFGFPKKTFYAKNVILSAAVMGTVGLLLKMKQKGKMPRVSDALGDSVRTNSETVLAITHFTKDVDFSKGVAITSSIHPDEHTHMEPVRYPKGSDFFGTIASVLIDGGGKFPRPLKYFLTLFTNPLYFFQASWPFGFAKRSLILLVMQTLDNKIRLVRTRRFAWPFEKTMSSALTEGEKTPSYIPIANDTARKIAQKTGGVPRSSINDVLLNAPITGHIMGGCVMGDSEKEGVIDFQNRVFGYQNLRICDSSMITVNLGVNPSLSITAITERAMSLIPPKEGFQPIEYRFEKEFGISSILGTLEKKSGSKKQTASKSDPNSKSKSAANQKRNSNGVKGSKIRK
ncbi:GMC family oxidoreductase [Leptospira yasudae]|uniref:Cholesterol oxidase n=1 Tax=Leptospira yasudae TaxID=2202201 RepID=A0A6N4QVE1_9LEPT|nr:GMC family oxidoreductase [Leptospira yasudae]TGL78632.1 GMC family oxidoreductase [Leptospira yasudae]TGL79924.1 GMC family oxidoreductase [Leptospira yasudae]TGL80745.1 GMC family oxidoreductase [Leptospira yasudae]